MQKGGKKKGKPDKKSTTRNRNEGNTTYIHTDRQTSIDTNRIKNTTNTYLVTCIHLYLSLYSSTLHIIVRTIHTYYISLLRAHS